MYLLQHQIHIGSQHFITIVNVFIIIDMNKYVFLAVIFNKNSRDFRFSIKITINWLWCPNFLVSLVNEKSFFYTIRMYKLYTYFVWNKILNTYLYLYNNKLLYEIRFILMVRIGWIYKRVKIQSYLQLDI